MLTGAGSVGKRNAYSILVGKLGGTALGRPRLRTEDNIKTLSERKRK
jgi:hypothetical protein